MPGGPRSPGRGSDRGTGGTRSHRQLAPAAGCRRGRRRRSGSGRRHRRVRPARGLADGHRGHVKAADRQAAPGQPRGGGRPARRPGRARGPGRERVGVRGRTPRAGRWSPARPHPGRIPLVPAEPVPLAHRVTLLAPKRLPLRPASPMITRVTHRYSLRPVAILAAVGFLLAHHRPAADACSRVTWLGPDGMVITGRSMDWPYCSTLTCTPSRRGPTQDGAGGVNSLTWTGIRRHRGRGHHRPRARSTACSTG